MTIGNIDADLKVMVIISHMLADFKIVLVAVLVVVLAMIHLVTKKFVMYTSLTLLISRLLGIKSTIFEDHIIIIIVVYLFITNTIYCFSDKGEVGRGLCEGRFIQMEFNINIQA